MQITKTNKQKQKRILDTDFKLQGQLIPQSIELEEAVLGAMMLEKNAAEKVLDILSEDVFFDIKHQYIFRAIYDLFNKASPIDLLTVTQELRNCGNLEAANGAYYITQLSNKVTSAANIEYHTHILIQKYVQRKLITVAGEISKNAFEETTDAFQLLDEAEKELFAIKNDTMKRNVLSLGEILSKAIKNIESLKSDSKQFSGIPSGINNLDKVTAGWQKSDLVIVAGRPGMGKTAFVLSIARNAAIDYHKPVAIFSLEMSSIQLVTRLISSEAELPSEKLRKGTLEEHEWMQLKVKTEKLADAPIFIDDTPGLSIFDFKAKARRLKSQHQIELIIIDYLQLMRGEEKNIGNREQEISYISRSLKGLAKELDIPVIALAQLSRNAERREGNKPQLSDLRESGSIEQDADMVGFIYRPEYYGITVDAENNDLRGVGEFIIAKHRNGPTETIQMKYRGEFTKFENFEESFSENWSFTDQSETTNIITLGSKINKDSSEFDFTDRYSDNSPF